MSSPTLPRVALFEAVLDDLRLAPEPLPVVIEDAHWADDRFNALAGSAQ